MSQFDGDNNCDTIRTESPSPVPASCSEWSPWDADDCPHCGSPAEIRTYAEEPGQAYDGDAARCMSCHCPGGIVADGERAWVMWHDELGCDCDWCKTHPPENCQCGHCGTDPQNAGGEQ